MVGFKREEPTAEHLNARMSVLVALQAYQDKLSAEEIVAILSHTLGQCVVMLDQRKYTPEMVMALVSENITQGNLDALQEIMNSKGNA